MLKSSDLRLGNWILDRGIPTQVSMLSIGMNFYSINGVNLDKKTGKVLKVDVNGKTYVSDEDRFSGIFLNTQVFKDLGFEEKNISYWWKGKFCVYYANTGLYQYLWHLDGFRYPRIIKYLHDLQNLYLDLTEQELSYHPSTISEKTE